MSRKRFAVLTSGGDCPGMNATVRAVVRACLSADVEILGIQKGYQGLIDHLHETLGTRAVSNMLQRGGTFLQSARCKQMLTEAGLKQAVDHLRELGVEGLVAVGGDGTLRGALALQRQGVRVIGIPASIDNDIPFTDMALGADTALNNIIHAVDCLKDTASSHDRTFVVETMGRNCGYLAVMSAIASGAEYALIPEAPYDIDDICKNLRRRYDEGRSNSILMVAEGAGKAQEIADLIKDKIGFETRIMILGHYQRGGSPTAFDRILAARFGVAAVEALLAGDGGKMVGLAYANIKLTELEQVVATGRKGIDPVIVKLSLTLGV